MDLSVVIPAFNESGNVEPLLEEIRQALDPFDQADYEVIFVDDGSTDASVAELQASALRLPSGRFKGLRVVRHVRSFGQSAAVHSGVKAATGRLIATLDGDGQNDPADIPALLTRLQDLMAATAGEAMPVRMVAGLRAKRKDTWSKRMSSKIANGVRSWMLKDDTKDTGCGLKVFERAAFLELPYFKHMHRFLPALMRRQGYATVSEPVNHRPRQRGSSKYGLFNRLWVGIVDLFGVMWLQRRANIPTLGVEISTLDPSS